MNRSEQVSQLANHYPIETSQIHDYEHDDLGAVRLAITEWQEGDSGVSLEEAFKALEKSSGQ